MNRRAIRFHRYDDILAEANRLLSSGYERVGNWSLAQICQHLAIIMEMSLDGFDYLFPWPMRAVARWFILRKVLRHDVFRGRYKAPKNVQPPETSDDPAGIARLQRALERLNAHTGPMKPSPVFGDLTPEEWREVHLWHAEHHFSFLLPRTAQ